MDENLINIKKEYRQNLYEKLNSAYGQLVKTLNEADKPSIQQTINGLESEIKQLEDDIEKLKLVSSRTENDEIYRKCLRHWEDQLPKIDFEKANRVLKSILGEIEKKEGAALFLLQNSRSMGGNWCIKNIKFKLQDMGMWYPPCEFEFLSYQQANPIDFLNFLAHKFSVQPCLEEIPTYTDEIINKICDSLSSGNIFFIQVDIYKLNCQDQFLDWFVHQFWCTLLERLPGLSQKHPLIRFVAVLSVRGSIPKDYLQPYLCCKKQNFDSKKILELPLQKWSHLEIKNWLFNFSGLTASHIGRTPLKRLDIEQMAQTIFQITQGKPSEVYSELMEAMSKLVS